VGAGSRGRGRPDLRGRASRFYKMPQCSERMHVRCDQRAV
jgi:hypothetical protein